MKVGREFYNMFIYKYVNDFYFSMVMFNYDTEYLNSLDEDNFVKIYNLFKKYKFYFIEDIVLNYLEIFSMEYDVVEEGMALLKDKLGDNFVKIIGSNMNYLDEIIKNNID